MRDNRFRVVILQRGISRHRVSFYEHLRSALAERDVELVVVQGHFAPWDQSKRDLATLPWAQVVRNRVLRIGSKELYWQPVLSYLKGVDLVIAEQANRLLINYLLQATRRLRGQQFAFWGHGRDFQTDSPGGLSERLKNAYTRHADWWFAYTELSARRVTEAGMSVERITVVQNAADTDVLQAAVAGLTHDDLEQARQESGIQSERAAVYCGGLYGHKRIDFMLDSARRVREQVSDFEFLVIGAGPEAAKIEAKARQWPWLRFVGPRFGAARVPLMKLARLQYMPGLVGLGIVDSFVLGVPLITTDIPIHSPEICYLENGANGLITADEPQAYADAVSQLLVDDAKLSILRNGCRDAAARYTVENMVANFADGVLSCLENPR
jgi:glycosyltransferase involved in cell wall biosynthesis